MGKILLILPQAKNGLAILYNRTVSALLHLQTCHCLSIHQKFRKKVFNFFLAAHQQKLYWRQFFSRDTCCASSYTSHWYRTSLPRFFFPLVLQIFVCILEDFSLSSPCSPVLNGWYSSQSNQPLKVTVPPFGFSPTLNQPIHYRYICLQSPSHHQLISEGTGINWSQISTIVSSGIWQLNDLERLQKEIFSQEGFVPLEQKCCSTTYKQF